MLSWVHKDLRKTDEKPLIKRIISFCGFAAFVSALSLAMAAMCFAGEAYSNGSNVNVRAEADTSAEIVGKLNHKDAVSILGKQGSFVKISYNGGEAFVSNEFIEVAGCEAVAIGDNVNVRTNKGKDVAGTLNKGDAVTAVARYGDYLVFDYDGQTGFVSSSLVECEFAENLPKVSESNLPTTYAEVVSSGTLNLRELPDTASNIVARLPEGDILDVLEKKGEWAKVRTYDNKTGYVSSEFVSIKTGVKPERPAASKGGEVISYAKQFLGTPYRYGGTNLKSGVDCSGFVYAVYKNFGITLNRTSSSMPANGKAVSKSELVAGDLVFFSNGGAKNIQHVGIYCGDGTFIHSATGGKQKVIVSGMNEDYYVRNYIKAARVFN